jgi:hypothetical protein
VHVGVLGDDHADDHIADGAGERDEREERSDGHHHVQGQRLQTQIQLEVLLQCHVEMLRHPRAVHLVLCVRPTKRSTLCCCSGGLEFRAGAPHSRSPAAATGEKTHPPTRS